MFEKRKQLSEEGGGGEGSDYIRGYKYGCYRTCLISALLAQTVLKVLL